VNFLNAEFSRFYREQYASVVSLFSRSIRSPDDAQDLAQEVFLLYLQKRRTGVYLENPSAWLFITARNYIRNYSREKWNTDVTAGMEMDIFKAQPEKAALCVETQSVWNDIVTVEMPVRIQKVFTYIGIRQYSLTMIAHEFGISTYSVKRDYQKACRIMLTSFRKKGVFSCVELL
jgi:RNA polymerase sigma-70 factor (ECF subfamily)